MIITNSNFDEIANLESKRSEYFNVIIKDSNGMNIHEANDTAKINGKVMLESHYFVDKNGTVISVRPVEYPTEFGNILVDKYSLVIELEGDFKWDNISALQYNSLIALLNHLNEINDRKIKKLIPLNHFFPNINNPGPNLPVNEINESIVNKKRINISFNESNSALKSVINRNLFLKYPYQKGNDVLTLKYKLEKLGYEFSEMNDEYNEETATNVNKLKKFKNMKEDGMVTKLLVAIIDEMLFMMDEEKINLFSASYNRLLYLNTPYIRGDDVLKLQEKLSMNNYYDGTFTSAYDEPTESAVRKFQEEIGLKVTGNVDCMTWRQLMSIRTIEFYRTIFLNDPIMEGNDIVAIQTKLAILGYLEIVSHGAYDEATETAVKKFQMDNDLQADGIVNSLTFNKLMSK